MIQNIEEGKIKEASARITLPAGGSEEFVVRSPSAADEKTSILSLTISNTASLTLDVFEDITINSEGTDLFIANSKTGSSSATNQVFAYGGDYTVGTKAAEDLFAAGTKNASSGAKSNDIRRIVSNGDTVRYEFTNLDGSNSQEMAVRIVFLEKEV